MLEPVTNGLLFYHCFFYYRPTQRWFKECNSPLKEYDEGLSSLMGSKPGYLVSLGNEVT